MHAATEKAIRDHFVAELENADDIDIGTVVYDNDGKTGAGVPQGRHARFSISPDGNAARQSFGSTAKLYRETGRVLVELFWESGVGDEGLLDAADVIAAFFRGRHLVTGGTRIVFEGLTGEAPSVTRRARVGAYWIRIVTIPYRAEAWLAAAGA